MSGSEIDQVRQMTAMMQVQEFIQTVRDKCFDKCITNPGRSLSANDQTCLQRCVDRYGEVLEVVQRAIAEEGM
eukprot:jgi/Ulvmu1/6398/UM003_0026.1